MERKAFRLKKKKAYILRTLSNVHSMVTAARVKCIVVRVHSFTHIKRSQNYNPSRYFANY